MAVVEVSHFADSRPRYGTDLASNLTDASCGALLQSKVCRELMPRLRATMTFRTRQVWLPLAIAWPIVLLAAEPTERQANRLARETSPYLLLHAHNPVDWYPWGRKAFAKAKRENKLIFLSIGYSSCYWCHVMERE